MDLLLAHEALKKYYGYDEFRPMQADIIKAIYEGKDTLVLMPTGGGKSICFQIPAITMDGVCVVVSPLISLMKDQVEGLRSNGIKAAFLNSSLSAREQNAVEDDLYNGNIKLLYVSPEKLVSQSFIPLLKQAKINLFAIDEAHCISSWGHDFRPEYTKMKFLKSQFKNIPVVALTATADKVTRRDIATQLNLDNPQVFISSFDRPNLSLNVRPGQKRIQQILDFIKARPNQSGIIYCLSRKNTEDLTGKLLKEGIKADFYHAGLPSGERAKVQEEFINDNVPIVCATVAFGMGIDKSNVRWVIHYNLPKNIESYYQEIGRAGRDGLKSDTLLFYSFRDVTVLREFIENGENAKQREIKMSKLDRMQQFADSLICRRKILLNYFGENLEKNCGNCDVCNNPPQHFDGTVLAQKALSAVTRLKERVGIRMLIDVLRGSNRKEIFQNGYDKIKTYGAGAANSANDWQHFINQIINLGFLEIAYDQKNVLRLTEASKPVLFGQQKVELVKMASIKEHRETQKAKLKKKTKTQRVRDDLFEVLRALRKKLARERGVPPYLVFTDATLEAMAANRPINDEEMKEIPGVGERKLHLYGNIFIDAIISFIKEKSSEGLKIQGTTYLVTHELYKEGFSVDEIATKRNLNVGTIYAHFAQLYEQGHEIDLTDFVSASEIRKVAEAIQKVEDKTKLKPIFDYLKEEIPYHKIRLVLAYRKRNVSI